MRGRPGSSVRRDRVLPPIAALGLALLACLAAGAAPARAASEPLYAWVPAPPPEGKPEFPLDGYLNGPCGAAVDSTGDVYVSDRYHDAVDVFAPGGAGAPPEFLAQLHGVEEPCGLALDSTGRLYVNSFHRGVARYTPSPYPVVKNATKYGVGTAIDPGPATGVAVGLASGHVYVDRRTYVNEYDASGSFLRRIGEGTLEDGYGVAVSRYPGTAGYVYVADAAANTIEAFDPETDPANPVQTIDGGEVPGGGFTSLRDSSVAVDDASGELYVLDDIQPAHASQPEAAVWVFHASGAYEGHLRYAAVNGAPSGLAVDNSTNTEELPNHEIVPTQGRAYVTSGNTHPGGLYAYAPEAATVGSLAAPSIPPGPLGGSSLFPTVPIGEPAAAGGGIICQGDSCQALPSEPLDPTLTTTLAGLGNPKVRYAHQRRRRHKQRGHRHRHHKHRHRRGARASSAAAGPPAASAAVAAAAGAGAAGAAFAAVAAVSGPPIEPGFEASAWDAGGEAATLAGSHPYALELSLGLDQGGGAADLREATIELPEGLLADPAGAGLCSAAAFAGGSCPARSQVGTLEVESPLGGGQQRFGLFDLEPAAGFAIELGASTFENKKVVLGGGIGADGRGAALTLSAVNVPAGLRAHGLRLSVWGVPWDASHNAERGDCLNEAEPSFPWAGCSVGDPLLDSQHRPLAFLTLPTVCGAPLHFGVGARSWQGAGEVNATADTAAPLSGCASLRFESRAEGLLTVKKASSSSGFVFRLTATTPASPTPAPASSRHPGAVRLELPKGVTLNPSVGAGLGVCEPAQLRRRDRRSSRYGAGCPNGSKIGDFSVRLALLRRPARRRDLPRPAQPLRANPFDSLLAVYLVAKSAERGIMVKLGGQDRPRPQRRHAHRDLRRPAPAPLHRPARSTSAPASARPWSPRRPAGRRPPGSTSPPGRARRRATTPPHSPITAGIDAGPCPTGATPPFAPGVVAGGVNSNVGSYTPYFVHLTRQRHRAGDHLLLAGPAAGDHRQARRHPLLPRGRDRGGAGKARLRRDRAPLLPGGLPGRAHPDRLRRRRRPHLRPRQHLPRRPLPRPAALAGRRSTPPRSAPSTSARS